MGRIKETYLEIMEETDFFQKHNHFLSVVAHAKSKEDQGVWLGWVETKIRQLTIMASNSISQYCSAYALPIRYETSNDDLPYAHAFFIGLTFNIPEGSPHIVDLREAVKSFKFRVLEYEDKKFGMDIIVKHLKRKQLPKYVFKNGKRP